MKRIHSTGLIIGLLSAVGFASMASGKSLSEIIPAPCPPRHGAGALDTGGDSPLTMALTWQGHGGIAIAALALDGIYNPSSTLVMDSIPPGSNVVYAAFQTTGWQGSLIRSSAIFSGVPLDTLMPTAYDEGGGYHLSMYRWDVTGIVSGNGSYSFSCASLAQSYLVFLVVIYENAAMPLTKIAINDGAESLESSSSTCFFNGFDGGNGSIKILTQAGDPSGDDESISLNGDIIVGPGNIFASNIGSHADYFDIPMTNIDLRDTLTIITGEDWIGIHLAVLTGDPATDISMTPVGAPIQIPPGGGSFDFRVQATNYTPNALDLDLWTRVILPNGSVIAPVLGPVGIILNTGSLNWLRHQSVPAGAPPGFYTYVGCLGEYPGQVWSMDSFPIEKTFLEGNDQSAACTGWAASADQRLGSDPEDGFDPVSVRVSPNPFNASAVLHYELLEACDVHLQVFDLAGRSVVTMADGWREAGVQEVTFSGSSLPAGIYLYRLRAADQVTCGNLMLIK
jgi:hypothetical protein